MAHTLDITLNEELIKLIDNSLSGYLYDIGILLHYLFKQKYICVKVVKNKVWFEFSNHKWTYNELGLFSELSTTVAKLFEQYRQKVSNDIEHFVKTREKTDSKDLKELCEFKLNSQDSDIEPEHSPDVLSPVLAAACHDADSVNINISSPKDFYMKGLSSTNICQDEEELVKVLYKKVEKIKALIGRLKNVNFKEQLCKECAYIFYDKNFMIKLDRDEDLICFNNGVLDLGKDEFRVGQCDDNISLSINADYPKNCKKNPILSHINKFKSHRKAILAKREAEYKDVYKF